VACEGVLKVVSCAGVGVCGRMRLRFFLGVDGRMGLRV
jgi:hypothetical protein